MTQTQEAAKNFPAGSFFRRFFEEKEIPDQTFEFTNENGVHCIIPNAVVVEHIAITSMDEQGEIAQVLRKIDFVNGDVNHFLAHLAHAIGDVEF